MIRYDMIYIYIYNMHICIEGHKLYMILLQVTQMSSYRASGPGGDLPKVEKKYPGSTTFPRKRGPFMAIQL